MDRAEAEALCARNAAEHPDRETHQWLPRPEPGGGWTVVKIGLAPQGPLSEEQESAERPPTADDPRAAIFQNIPPYGAGF